METIKKGIKKRVSREARAARERASESKRGGRAEGSGVVRLNESVVGRRAE